MKTAAYDSYVDKNKVLAEEVEHKVSFFTNNFFDFLWRILDANLLLDKSDQ